MKWILFGLAFLVAVLPLVFALRRLAAGRAAKRTAEASLPSVPIPPVEMVEDSRPPLAEQESLSPYLRELNQALEAEPNSETLSRLKTLRDELEDARLRLQTPEGDKAAGQLLEKVEAAIAELEDYGGRKAWLKRYEQKKVARLRDHLKGVSGEGPSPRTRDEFRRARREIARLQAAFQDPQAQWELQELAQAVDSVLRDLEPRDINRAMEAGEASRAPSPGIPEHRRAARPDPQEASGDLGSQMIALTDLVLGRYAWALVPSQIREIEDISELIRSAGEHGRRQHERELTSIIERIMDRLPECVRLFLLCMSHIQSQVAPVDKGLASRLAGQLDEIEQACKAGAPGADQRLKRFYEELVRSKPAATAPVRRKSPVPHASTPTLEPQMADVTCARLEPPCGSAEMPTTLTDRVHFSVTAPREVVPGAAFVLDIWAHLEQQRAEVLERARQHVGGGPIYVQEKGPVRVARGTVLTVRVQVEGMVIQDPEDTILWEGDIGSANFPVQVPKDALPGPRAGTARFYVDAFEVAKLHFALSVGRAMAEPDTLSAQMKRYRSAFASYASEDNDEVLNILQGIKMGMPDLDVFYAEASLRAGERWPERLKQEIMARDVFYLFWSRAASVSPWVDMEWRFALEKRGIDVIKPVPLAPPHVVPPPPELAAELHFNDWILAHKRQVARAHS